VIAGPTAAGKTELALQIAEEFGAVVVSADAMQVYRGMDIGTAKVSEEERARVPHYGIDVVAPDERFDAADFIALCDRVLAEHPRVVICGGSSLYIRSVKRGLVQTPPADLALRAELAKRSDLHARLTAIDPVLAERLHPNDQLRIIRGIEVFEATGIQLSELHAAHEQQPDRVDIRGIWLDRVDLDERIDERVSKMMERGYLDEVRSLLESFEPTLKPMRSLGYRHLAEHLSGGLDLEEAVRRTQRDTRRFARKQRTWRKHLGLDGGDARELARTLWSEV